MRTALLAAVVTLLTEASLVLGQAPPPAEPRAADNSPTLCAPAPGTCAAAAAPVPSCLAQVMDHLKEPFECVADGLECLSYGEDRYFWVSGEYLLWWLKGDTVPPLVTTGPIASKGQLGQAGTSVLLGGSDLNDDQHSGFRLNVGYWLDDTQTWSLQVDGFILERASTGFFASSDTFPVLSRPFFNVNTNMQDVKQVAAPGLATGAIRARSDTRLGGIELDAARNLGWGTWYRLDLLTGFRYLDLHESLAVTDDSHFLVDVTNTNPPIPAGTTLKTFDGFAAHNRFFGAQLGAAGELREGPWIVSLQSKVAIGGSVEELIIGGFHATPGASATRSTRTRAANVNMARGGFLALGSNSGSFGRGEFAFVPEVGVSVGYQLTSTVRIFAGYDFLYWSSVFRPDNQIDPALDVRHIPNFPHMAAAPSSPHPVAPLNGNDFWAQGLHCGLEFRY
jgi:hypothetical protein